MIRANRFIPRQHVINQAHKILKQRKKASNVFRPNQSSTVTPQDNFHTHKRHPTFAGSISGQRSFGSLVSQMNMKQDNIFASQKAQFTTTQVFLPIRTFKYTPALISFAKPALTLGTSIHTISTLAAIPTEVALENLETSQSRIHTMTNSATFIDDSIDANLHLNQSPSTPSRQNHGTLSSHKHNELHISSNDANLIDTRNRVDDELYSRHNEHSLSKHESFHNPVSSSQLPRADATLTGLGFDLEDELRIMMRPKFKPENNIIDKFNAVKGHPAQDHYRHTWE